MRLAILLAFLAFPALAEQDWHFTIGEEMTHGVSVCIDLADAKAIVNADRDGGEAAGKKVWEGATRCRNVTVSGGPLVGKIVYSVKTKREGGEIVLRVVEILGPDGKEVLAYFITAKVVLPAGRGV